MLECQSCNFGPGYRTGEVLTYTHCHAEINLCDDCVRRAGGADKNGLTLWDAEN
jgi:hypothetical protein